MTLSKVRSILVQRWISWQLFRLPSTGCRAAREAEEAELQAGEEAGGNRILPLKQLIQDVEGVLAEHQDHSTLGEGRTEDPGKQERQQACSLPKECTLSGYGGTTLR